MPNPFTSQVKIVPDQEQQHISIGLESLSQNLSKIQTMKDLADQAKIDQFNKLADVSLTGFWQRDKDELFQGEQDYLDNVAKVYKEHGGEGVLPYKYQAQLDKEKSELMALLEQSKADAEWYKTYMKQVAWDKTGKVDIEASTAPLKEWMEKSIDERSKIDKSKWFKLKAKEINLQKEIGDRANSYLKKSKSKTVTYDDDGNPIETTTWEGVSKPNKKKFVKELIADPDVGPMLKKEYTDNTDLQKEFPLFSDYVTSRVPGMGTQDLKTPITTGRGGKGDDPSRYDLNANNQYDYFPTTDTVPETSGDPNSKQGMVTSRTSVPVGILYTQKGRKMTIESVKVVPTAKKRVRVSIPGILHVPKTQKEEGAAIFDDELQDYTDNIEDKAVVVVSYIKEETVRVKPDSDYDISTKVVKTKVYETIPYNDDIKAYLIKSGKFGEKLDKYIRGIVNQPSGGANSNTGGSYSQD